MAKVLLEPSPRRVHGWSIAYARDVTRQLPDYPRGESLHLREASMTTQAGRVHTITYRGSWPPESDNSN